MIIKSLSGVSVKAISFLLMVTGLYPQNHLHAQIRSVSLMGWSEQAETLPIGGKYFQLEAATSTSKSRFGRGGSKEPLGAVAREKTLGENGQEYIRDYELKISYYRIRPTWAYGMTKNWSLGARVSLYSIEASVDTKYYLNNEGQLLGLEPSEAKGQFISDTGAMQSPKEKESAFLINDIELLNKLNIRSSDKIKTTVIQSTRFPFSKQTQFDYLLHKLPEARSFGFKLGGVAQYEPRRSYYFSSHVSYLFNLRDEVEKKDIETGQILATRVQRNPGNVFQASVQNLLPLMENMSLASALIFERKERDHIDSLDEQYEDTQYEQLGLQLELRFTKFNFLNMFSNTQRPVGGTLMHYLPVSGVNTDRGSTTGLSLQTFF